jgi:hypothetical protein
MRMPDVVLNSRIAATADCQRRRLGAGDRVGIESLLRAAGHQVEIKTLRAAEGGLEACVMPLKRGNYRFVCDDAPAPDEPDDIACLPDPRQFRVSFRLAHELAHTALGGHMAFASRHGAGASSAGEARCDGFAVLFLVDRVEAREATDESDVVVRSLAQRLNVPPRLVRLAATCTT